MNPLWSIIIPAACGLLSGVIGSLIAPWVNWGIEKKREERAHRRQVIQECRRRIDHHFSRRDYFGSQEYLRLKQFISEEDMKVLERTTVEYRPNGEINDFLTAKDKIILVKAVETLEKRWELK